MSQWWDDDVAMLWNPPRSFDDLFPPLTRHVVPPTVWHALALLHRGTGDDVPRALRAIHAVAACQYDEPGTPWHGTFARFREFPYPQPDAVEYAGFDPNWRQFVGTGFLLALRTAGDRIPSATAAVMTRAIRLALDGEPADRVSPAYSNIALMRAWLEVEGGAHVGRDDLVRRGGELAVAVVERFRARRALDEWNSPTYYGIDLYALALWRSQSELLGAWGAEIEGGLWADLAPWYHAGLANVAGPYTRAYGMDMRSYAAALGFWISPYSHGQRPTPDLDRPFRHTHDLSLWPIAALLGSDVPDGPCAHLREFQGERTLEQVLSTRPERVASAWLASEVMIGAERGARTWKSTGQYHPATIHWRAQDGATGWVRLHHAGPVEATAGTNTLTARGGDTARPIRFRVSGYESVEGDRWCLPGLTVRVQSNAEYAGVEQRETGAVLTYEPPASGPATFELDVS